MKQVKRLLALCALLAAVVAGRADERMYRCEFGIEGGCGYYVGDAQRHIFMNVREAYGASFRYRFDQRWALQAKGMGHRIVGNRPDSEGVAEKGSGKWTNQLVNIDVMAEFNFFRFGEKSYDRRVKPYTPYIAIGLGAGVHSDARKVSAYMPFTIGFKWKFAPRFNLTVAWQHNVYFADNLENVGAYNDTYRLNGSNIFNCDLTGTLTAGLTFEFAKDKKVCRMCKWN